MRVSDFTALLQTAGIKVVGVSAPKPARNLLLCIFLSDDSTADDYRRAYELGNQFDWTEKPRPTYADCAAKVSQLSPEQKQKLLDLVVLQVVQRNPALLEQA